MKKIGLIVIMLILFATIANASVNGFIDGRPIVKVVSNGVELIPDGTPAMIYDNYTLVPINTLRQLGFKVTWNQDTYTVTVTPPEPTIIKVIVDAEGKPIEGVDSGKPPLDAEGETITPAPSGSQGETTPTPSPTATPTPTPSPTPTPEPDNTLACQQINEKYALDIFRLENTSGSGARTELNYLNYYRDQELAALGC